MLMMSVALMSCSFAKSELKKVVEEVNKECPVSYGIVGELSGVEYDEDENEVVMTVALNKNLPMNLSALEGVKGNLKRATMGSWADSDDVIEMMKKIANADARLTMVMRSEKTGESLKIKFSENEVKEVADGKVTPITNREMLQIMVASTNAQCPMQMDEMTVLTSVSLEGDYFVYVYSIDESELPIESIRQNKGMVKENIRPMLQSDDPAIKMVLKLCNEANVGITYRYVGNSSGDACDIQFSPSEL